MSVEHHALVSLGYFGEKHLGTDVRQSVLTCALPYAGVP